jgi:hypothetical protein
MINCSGTRGIAPIRPRTITQGVRRKGILLKSSSRKGLKIKVSRRSIRSIGKIAVPINRNAIAISTIQRIRAPKTKAST